MQRTNEKTQTTFAARTTKEFDCFLAIVTRREGNTEKLIYREKHATRGKAYRNAQREMVYAYWCHANVHGV